MLYVLLLDPTSVCDPVAVTAAVSLFTRPAIDASPFVSAVPSYALLSDPVVIVTGAGLTVSLPSTVVILVKFAVLSSPAAFLMTYPSLTAFALSPASVWLPVAVASTVKPSGRPDAVTFFSPVPSHVRAVPSYVLVSLGAVRTTLTSFFVTFSFPRLSLIV